MRTSVPWCSSWAGLAECLWGILLLMLSPLSQASRDLAQINDLQAQLEEANKEKQELQEKVRTRGSLGRECQDHYVWEEPPSSQFRRHFSLPSVIHRAI